MCVCGLICTVQTSSVGSVDLSESDGRRVYNIVNSSINVKEVSALTQAQAQFG